MRSHPTVEYHHQGGFLTGRSACAQNESPLPLARCDLQNFCILSWGTTLCCDTSIRSSQNNSTAPVSSRSGSPDTKFATSYDIFPWLRFRRPGNFREAE